MQKSLQFNIFKANTYNHPHDACHFVPSECLRMLSSHQYDNKGPQKELALRRFQDHNYMKKGLLQKGNERILAIFVQRQGD
jgi:hypothetical protein